MEGYRLEITPLAEQDLNNIWRYIARDNPAAAARYSGELIEEAESLLLSPFRGQPFRFRAGKRKLGHGSYLIIYEVRRDEKIIRILRFWHGAQNPRGLRLKEEAASYGLAAFPSPAAAVT